MQQKSQFQEFILDNDILGVFPSPITLKSGRQSSFYVNWRRATADAYLLHQLSDYIVTALKESGWQFDCIYGVPEGASKTALLCGYKWAQEQPSFAKGSHPLPMGRAKPKAHGHPEDRFFVGAPKGRVVVLEDTITSGISLFDALAPLQEAGVEIAGVVCLTDRQQQLEGYPDLEAAMAAKCGYSVPVLALSQASDLLPLLAERGGISEEIKQALVAEFQEFARTPLEIKS